MTVQPVPHTWPSLPQRVPEGELRTYGAGSRGGSSTVFDVFGHEDRVLYKKYAIQRSEADLDRLVRLHRELDSGSNDGAFLRRRFAWPLAVVTADDGAVSGVLVPKAEMTYRAQLSTNRVRARDFNYLLYETRAARVGVEPATVREKLVLLRLTVEAFAWLEERGLVHEDISAGNLLWSVRPEPAVLILDCDSIRPAGSAVDDPLLTTTDWTDPRVLGGEVPRPDQASVTYAVGLLTARVFGTPSWRPSATDSQDSPQEGVPAALLPVLLESVRATAPRPPLHRWLAILDEALEDTPARTRTPRTAVRTMVSEPLRQGGLSYGVKERVALAVGLFCGAVAAILLLVEML
ncbi:hypothetical protein [Streptomyces olivochromogenes]|uniref:Protein kinase domain-containing protein n=1 Tax=Streptomyces olivochromogenes TaxID=1963 RepID=A0A250VQZ9_STROL|nr:hypothetical protein [Streptomyces olivochromogenes]KUN42633.1 hypothetical protein AQJ27_35705 [Streptomyces olivochromogenes]GAX56571.1 hypothetical protein SO3561_08139 [Streptomyces olivochromogenes]